MYRYLQVMTKYASFSGRARRREFWMFAILNLLLLTIAMISDGILGITFSISMGYQTINLPLGYISLLFALVVTIPTLSVTVRRIHDLGKSGWSLLMLFIPLLGIIWFLDMMTTESASGNNSYGINQQNPDVPGESGNYQYN